MSKLKIMVVAMLCCHQLLLNAQHSALLNVSGRVFEDTNKNGILDKGEKGIPGVLVSNRKDVVKSGKDGFYQLEIDSENGIVMISKPAGYLLPLNEYNQPQFYYVHRLNGSPKGLNYEAFKPTGNIDSTIDFPLYKTVKKEKFKALIVGDPQVDTHQEVDFFRSDVVEDMLDKEVDFYLALGDLVGDNISLYPRLKQTTAPLEMPIFNVFGNHDVNYKATGSNMASESYIRHFGPDYYSFDYGNVHFIALNSVKYFGWNHENSKRGDYFGGIAEIQMEWLANDLEATPKNKRIVIASHIPMLEDYFYKDDIQKVFGLLKDRPHLLALAGHLHYIQTWDFDQKTLWSGEADFHAVDVGAACGSWWSAPFDERGLPLAYCGDGSPNGYYIFSFDKEKFNYEFYPANEPDDFQIRISSPEYKEKLSGEDIRIFANVFSASDKARVYYQLDGGEEIEMKKASDYDPFFVKHLENNRQLYKFYARPKTCTHCWEAYIPASHVEKGVHKLKVIAHHQTGKQYETYRIFEVTK